MQQQARMDERQPAKIPDGVWDKFKALLERDKAEAAMQQAVRVDNKRQQQDDLWRCQQTGGGSVTRCYATTSQV
jgi:hypothetical protein